MIHQFESLSARLEGRYVRPVAAFLVAGSLMGFVVGQQLGHAHPATLHHNASRHTVSAPATPHHTPIATPGPTNTPTAPTNTQVTNPVASYNPPAAQPPGKSGGNDDGGDGGHDGGDGGGGGNGGHGHHGG